MSRPILFALSLLGGMTSSLSLPSFTVSAKAQTTQALPPVSPLFTDNMVLQREKPIKVWGWLTPGENVTVKLAGKSAKATADKTGKWLAVLPPMKAGGPYTMDVEEKKFITTYSNLLIGDVWICSGQSNMEMGIGAAKDAEKEIAAANYPNIRLYTVPKKVAYSKENVTNGKWEVCTPQTVSANGWGGFSAVGYYFGRKLNQELNVPIGLIHTSWGGTIAEAWVSGESLATMNDFKGAVAQVAATAKDGDGDLTMKMKKWWLDNEGAPAKGYQNLDYSADKSRWKTMKLPSTWETAGLPGFDGLVYFRREVEIPQASAGKEAVLSLGTIDDRDVTYVNGQMVGMMNQHLDNRVYKIPAGVLKAGKNVIAVTVLDTGGEGGIYGTADMLHLEMDGHTYDLSGDWQYLKGEEFTRLKPVPVQMTNNPNVSTVLFNGMVNPLVPFAIKGAIWYQGESNAGRAEQYSRLLPTLIKDWRKQFEVGDFPFYIVQLASYMARDAEPKSDAWPLLREAQEMTATNVKNAGIAVAIDIGEANDIHPKNKQEVGRRLALDALAQTYGVKVAYSGPVYKAMKAENGNVIVQFSQLNGGLMTTDNAPVKGFAVAGENKKFYWADARIVGNTVVVSSSWVKNPTAVRYAWGNNPDVNLVNKVGLPTVPFRTDRF